MKAWPTNNYIDSRVILVGHKCLLFNISERSIKLNFWYLSPLCVPDFSGSCGNEMENGDEMEDGVEIQM